MYKPNPWDCKYTTVYVLTKVATCIIKNKKVNLTRRIGISAAKSLKVKIKKNLNKIRY